jgi:(p)ppGpp synthase/HD superfamily hydrolase
MAIVAHDRPFFLRDVWNIISDQDLNVADVEVKVNRAENARITICVDIENWLQFHEVLTRIGDLPGAISVCRQLQPLDLTRERAKEELLA